MMKFQVEVAYATPYEQRILTVDAETGETIRDVIKRSRILELFPEIDLSVQKIGIFGNICNLSDTVSVYDRIEIYRPLSIDPKEARKRAALKAARLRSIARDGKPK